jgi:electron transport complex protein RnfB
MPRPWRWEKRTSTAALAEPRVVRLAALTGRPVRALDAECGTEEPRSVVVIDEDWCIGCTLCIKACPVDAIVANKLMHTVLAEDCTGCAFPPARWTASFPSTPVAAPRVGTVAEQAQHARQRYAQHQQRLAPQARAETSAISTTPQKPVQHRNDGYQCRSPGRSPGCHCSGLARARAMRKPTAIRRLTAGQRLVNAPATYKSSSWHTKDILVCTLPVLSFGCRIPPSQALARPGRRCRSPNEAMPGMSCTRVPPWLYCRQRRWCLRGQGKDVHVAVVVGCAGSVMVRKNCSRLSAGCAACVTNATASSAVPCCKRKEARPGPACWHGPQVFCLGNGVFHHLRVLLGDLVQLAYRRADLLQACALFGRRGRISDMVCASVRMASVIWLMPCPLSRSVRR